MYSKRWINIVSFIIALIIFLIVNILLNASKNNTLANSEEGRQEIISDVVVINEEENEQTQVKIEENEEKQEVKEKTLEKWQIEIPEISLVAKIAEGTSKEILDEYVGHFEITPEFEGNVGLAAHNRGYPVNYFANLKNLKGGETIIYTYGDYQKTYVVIKNIKISDIDWSYLENSSENKLTLITCIANEPAYRRCVQAIEKN